MEKKRELKEGDTAIFSLFPYLSSSVDDTERFGIKFGALLEKGDAVALYGGLGAGKTAFVKGVVKGIFPEKRIRVKSPSFAIVNIYEGDGFDIFHIDCYRLDEPEEFLNIGIEEVLNSGKNIVLIEWPSKIEELLNGSVFRINISISGINTRKYELLK